MKTERQAAENRRVVENESEHNLSCSLNCYSILDCCTAPSCSLFSHRKRLQLFPLSVFWHEKSVFNTCRRTVHCCYEKQKLAEQLACSVQIFYTFVSVMELQCDICFNPFDLDHHRPKNLPCGHSICVECVQNPALGGKCPVCRKDLNADPADIPDSILAIRLIEHNGVPPRKNPRTEETEVQQLRQGVEAGRKVVEVLVLRLVVPRAVEALNRQLDSSVAQLRQVEEALERQVQRGAAGGEGSAPVGEQLHLAVQLEDNLRPLTAKKCSVVAEEEDGATWRACAELGGFGDILRLLLLPLRADGQLEKVDVAPCFVQPGDFVGPPIISVLRTTENDFKDGRLKINDILQDRQRWRHTRSLKIFHGAAGLEELLSVVAPHLEELVIGKPVQPSVMVEVEKMKSIKRLGVTCESDLDYPDLPLQLEELGMWHPGENQLRCVERMARLRSLQVIDYLGPEMNFAPS
ncbi:uncharacterized protein LOC113212504 [Frankliniella occidentalis]|uniref:Uncharacterized protein LOC113212504 n=1 Tax=Frankliniella occidentalis TaxID=133901 RepID=A0A9C6X0D1_FRAOC|nr:uncharacterized protein LOC113212504 [Frankliniella occidentalis]